MPATGTGRRGAGLPWPRLQWGKRGSLSTWRVPLATVAAYRRRHLEHGPRCGRLL